MAGQTFLAKCGPASSLVKYGSSAGTSTGPIDSDSLISGGVGSSRLYDKTFPADRAVAADLIRRRPISLHLFGMRKFEKFFGDVIGLANEVFGDAVTGHDQEADVAAGLTDLFGNRRLPFGLFLPGRARCRSLEHAEVS